MLRREVAGTLVEYYYAAAAAARGELNSSLTQHTPAAAVFRMSDENTNTFIKSSEMKTNFLDTTP